MKSNDAWLYSIIVLSDSLSSVHGFTSEILELYIPSINVCINKYCIFENNGSRMRSSRATKAKMVTVPLDVITGASVVAEMGKEVEKKKSEIFGLVSGFVGEKSDNINVAIKRSEEEIEKR